MAINTQRLALRFEEATRCTAAKAQEKTQEYLWQCARAMVIDHFSDESESGYYINASEIQNKLREIEVKKQKFWVWKTFQSFPERVFDIILSGSKQNKKYTMARARYTLEDILLATGTPKDLAVEVYKPFKDDILRGDSDDVVIDLRSLENFIKSNLSHDRDNPKIPAKYLEKLDRNLKHAQKIWMLASANDGELIQVINNSNFGRKYYKGPNLQNTPKEVRHAALGDCYEYDLESSVFAWKLSWFQQICKHRNQRAPKPATLEYIDHKQAIRKRLANVVFGDKSDWSVKVIKEFITAIGFGAPARGIGYVANGKYQKPALAQIITAKTRLDLALNDPWVKEFIQEQNDMNDAIVALAKVNMIDELKTVPELWDRSGKKLLTNSVVSYMYQHAEKEILDWVEDFCADREVLLTVHDCIYTRKRVDLMELRAGLQMFGDFFKVSFEEHRAWTWEDPIDVNDPFYDPREAVVEKLQKRYAAKQIEGYFTGAGHDGTAEYNFEDDPYYQD